MGDTVAASAASANMPAGPMPRADIDRCAAVAAEWAEGDGGGGGGGGGGEEPIFLAYTSHLPPIARWFLGITAAMYGSPLVIAGLGDGAH